MVTATFRFYGPLNDFLPKRQRQTPFDWPVSQQATIKDVIESLGVPHPEIGLLLANSRAVSFNYRIQPDDRCSVYPAFYDLDVSALAPLPAPLLSPLRFVLDTHLGKLATYLRLLGFDTVYRNTFADEELAQLSARDKRVLLTRDRGLLMRSVVQFGYFVRNTQPSQQLLEIIHRYELKTQLMPFSRCLVCNGELQSVEKAQVVDRLPPHVRDHQQSFLQCTACGKVFWEGSHYDRMQEFIHLLFQTSS